MAFRTWARLSLATLGVSALAGASQLGLAYGLGIVRLTGVLEVTTRDQWTAQLAWVAWFAMTAAVVGALAGTWLLPTWSSNRRPGAGMTVAIALAAGIGAAVVVPLTMQPARSAQIPGVHPVFVIGACAGLGALVGAVAAGAALMRAVSRWSLATLGIAVWVIAIVSVAPTLGPGKALPAVRLGVLDADFLPLEVTQRTALFTMPVLAFLAGAVLGWAARRRGHPTLAIALAGLPGPALLTLAYLIAGPGSGDDRYQVVPYWAAMTATGAGVLGSVLAAVLGRGGPDDADGDADGPSTGGSPQLADTGVLDVSPTGPSPVRTDDGPERVPRESTTAGSAQEPPPADPQQGWVRRSSAADAFTTRSGQLPIRRGDGRSGDRPQSLSDIRQPNGRHGSTAGDQPGRRRRGATGGDAVGLALDEHAAPRSFGRGRDATETVGSFAGEPVRHDRIPARGPFAPRTVSPLPPEPAPETVPPVQAGDKGRTGKQRRTDDDYVDWVSGLGSE